MSESLRKPIISAVTLYADGRPAIELISDRGVMFDSINIYESISNSYVTGNINIIDAYGLLEAYPIVGDEYIHISFKSNRAAPIYEKLFKVFKIDNLKDLPAKKTQLYTLHFATTILDESQKRKLRLSFLNKRDDEIVKSICLHSLNIKKSALTIEKTLKQRTFVVPDWSPLKTIEYFCNTAERSSPSKSLSYVFYEDSLGWNFKSIESMFSDELFTKLTTSITDNIKSFNYNNIISYSIDTIIDNITNSQKGYYGSTTREVDLIEKKVKIHEHKFSHMLNGQTPIDEVNNPIRATIGNDNKRKTSIISSNGNNKYAAENTNRRGWFKQQFQNYKITLEMLGSSAFTVGKLVSFDIPTVTVLKSTNKYLSGNYIMTDIWHSITPHEHKMLVTIRKPTFKTKILAGKS